MRAEIFHSHIMKLHQELYPNVKIETSCVIRHPVEWAHSWYRFRKRPELLAAGGEKAKMYSGEKTFEQFVLDLVSADVKLRYARIGSQHRFIELENGNLGVDKIFRFDDGLNHLEEYFSSKIGEHIHLDRMNVSQQEPLEISSELKDRLISHFQRDFDLYERQTDVYM